MIFLITIFIIQGTAVFLGFLKVISKHKMTNLIRFSYAIFLLFSGFVKILDPLGFSYKLQEYFEVFNMEWLFPWTLFLSISICVLEIFIGFFLIYGIHLKKILYCNLILMIGFTFLTFYSAYFDAVTDCGCFGDFMKMEPWFSFKKDVVLLIVSLLLFYYQQHIKSFLKIEFINRSLIILFFGTLFIPVYSLSHLPFIDFRAYKIGNSIIEGRQLPENAQKDVYEDIWYYEIDGELKEFSTSDEPWNIQGKDGSPAIFKDRSTKLLLKGDEPPIHDFDIINQFDNIDMTDSILNLDKVFLMISYDIQKTNIEAHSLITDEILNSLVLNDIPIYGLSSSSLNEIKNSFGYSDDMLLPYEYFLMDQITLKTIIRSNPGLVMLQKGKVSEKWHWRDIPEDWSEIIN